MKILKGLILFLLVSVFGAGLWKGIEKTDLLKINAVKVEGAASTTENRLRNLMTVKVGDPIWTKSVEKQALLLKKDPWVESARVRRVFPNSIIVEVREKVPFAVVGSGKGEFKYVDSNNNLIDAAEPVKAGHYPLLLGRTLATDLNLRGEAIGLLKSLPQEGLMSLHDLSDVRYDADRGFQIRLAKTGMLIDIGKENIPLHVDRARRVVEYLDQHNINASRVDSDYSKKVLVKVRKGR
jgi:cell division septal protein FtsQ